MPHWGKMRNSIWDQCCLQRLPLNSRTMQDEAKMGNCWRETQFAELVLKWQSTSRESSCLLLMTLCKRRNHLWFVFLQETTCPCFTTAGTGTLLCSQKMTFDWFIPCSLHFMATILTHFTFVSFGCSDQEHTCGRLKHKVMSSSGSCPFTWTNSFCSYINRTEEFLSNLLDGLSYLSALLCALPAAHETDNLFARH